MGHASTKRAVRDRDKKCIECGMTNEEHNLRFGNSLHVHRTKFKGQKSLGEYKPNECVALCHLCHEAMHSPKCAVRKRDGYVCRECGLTEEEHKKIHDGKPLDVHAPRTKYCYETEWEQCGVTADECVTLCIFCHHAKHSVDPLVLKRDGFHCVQCGKPEANHRLWHLTLAVHRLDGFCHEQHGIDADPGCFETLCHSCHEARHPDKLTEYVKAGWRVELRKVPDGLRIPLPVTSRAQLALYKEYLKLVHAFAVLLDQQGLPAKIEIPRTVLLMPKTALPYTLRIKAAWQAVDDLQDEANRSEATKKKLNRMSEEQRNEFLAEEKKKSVEGTLWGYLNPTIAVYKDRETRSVEF